MNRKEVPTTCLQDWVKAYDDAGYVMPHVVFHNLNGSHRNAPAMSNVRNVSMVSVLLCINVFGLSDYQLRPSKIFGNTVLLHIRGTGFVG